MTAVAHAFHLKARDGHRESLFVRAAWSDFTLSVLAQWDGIIEFLSRETLTLTQLKQRIGAVDAAFVLDETLAPGQYGEHPAYLALGAALDAAYEEEYGS